MRTGACLRMVLYAEGRFVFQADAFYGVVVQVDVGDDGIGRIAHIVRVHTKTVVLGGDLTFAGHQVFDRLVGSAMAVMHFISADAIGQCQQLMPQTNAEEWFAAVQDLLHGLHRIVHGSRIAGTVGNEEGVRVPFYGFTEGCFGRKYF